MEVGAMPRTHWPAALGVIGIVIAALSVFDEAGELIRLFTWDEADWARIFGAETARLIEHMAPPLGFMVVSAVINLELAVLLFVGSILLLRRQRAGVSCCRAWAWIVLPWLVVQLVLVLTWLRDLLPQLLAPELMPSQATVSGAVIFGFMIVAIYPVFLLVWFARPRIRAEYVLWDIGSPMAV
jgi:hypothetical protein